MSGPVFLPGVGKATLCEIAAVHRPAASRFVWHHIQPQVAGGLSVKENLAEVCDNCHYTIHSLLWHLNAKTPAPVLGTRKQRAMAQAGFDACVAAGTTGKIPNEGGV